MVRQKQLHASVGGTAGTVFAALGMTLAFRRWGAGVSVAEGPFPARGCRYRHGFGSVVRAGRIVEVLPPVAVTLTEVLMDPPCRVGLKLRWRIEPGYPSSVVRLNARIRLNHAAWLRRRHWDRRLEHHFRRQLDYLAKHVALLGKHNTACPSGAPPRDGA